MAMGRKVFPGGETGMCKGPDVRRNRAHSHALSDSVQEGHRER